MGMHRIGKTSVLRQVNYLHDKIKRHISGGKSGDALLHSFFEIVVSIACRYIEGV